MTPRRLPVPYRRIVLLSIIVFVAFCCRQAQVRNEQNQARDARLASMQERIVAQVEPLCRALLPAENTLAFNFVALPLYGRGSQPRNHYSVECRDARGEQRVQILWDEDARHPYSVSVVPNRRHSHALPAKDVVNGPSAGSDWMCRLGLVAAQDIRANRARVDRFASVEVTRIALPGRMAMAWTNRATGELRQITIYQHPTAPDLQALQMQMPAAPPHT